ncbi:NEDD8 ultimate buster 1 [Pseudochaenichthys georgianus]|uniref:NEDD8 ultimate buster 1 n=1 Tax=Pseudochaenichthys georgianus TaxID=52239 RepID=UPI00146C0450|nr:NEDD8 ultimate buster 1 [Pseudochaenichthys georgianus]XP_033933361.1 NEDD8 ultimate buster 1 [Pseudochaenichthys georgianus]
MADQNLESKLKQRLKQEKIQLWIPPYTEEDNRPGTRHMQDLAERFAPLLCVEALQVESALEGIRVQAVIRWRGNQTFRETSVASVELLLPRGAKKTNQDPKTKNYLETRLDVLAQEVVDRIGEEYGLKYIKLILNGKTLSADQRLDVQNVRNHSKVMVLKVSDTEWKQQQSEEEEKTKSQSESLQRTEKGFQILSERDGSEDTSPFLEIADQRGNPLNIPHQEKKALILAMGFHEKGRSLMKKKQFDNALSHLLQADQQFSKCGSALLSSVDNFAVLQLDIVWSYRALEALSCLEDGKLRLLRAEDAFLKVYGEQQQRLRMIKGSSGREEVLFLRLYLLQSLLSYLDGNDAQARQQLSKVEVLFARLSLDSEKMSQLVSLGFSEREARLGLRATQGDIQEAITHITNQREEREELQQRERQRRRRRSEVVSTLTELGFSRRDASKALQLADGDVDAAYQILLDSKAAESNNNSELSPEAADQLLYMGFERSVSETALALTGGNVQEAIQLLLDHQGVLPSDMMPPPPSLLSPPSSSPDEEEPSTSSSTADSELVSEVLEDLSRHEEDYLDLTLEEENELIQTMKRYLSRTHPV